MKLKVPLAVGVPERTPPELRLMPVGSAPDVTAQEYGAVPFAAVSVVEGYAALTMTVASCPDAVVTVNVALPPVAQPATKRMAIRAEIPSARQNTPLRLMRKSLSITAILLGCRGIRPKEGNEGQPGPAD